MKHFTLPLVLLALTCCGPRLHAQDNELAPLAKEHLELVPTLVSLLADNDGELRQYAAATLVLVGRDNLPALLEGFKTKSPHAQANLCYVVGHMLEGGEMSKQERALVPHVLKLVGHKDPEVRRRAAFCLHRMVGGQPPAQVGGLGGVLIDGVAPPPFIGTSTLEAPPDPGLLLPEVESCGEA